MLIHALLMALCPAYRAKNKKLRDKCARHIGRVPSLLSNKELAEIIRHHLKYRRLRDARSRRIARSIDESVMQAMSRGNHRLSVAAGNMRTAALRRQREDYETIPPYMFNPDPAGNWASHDSSGSCRNSGYSNHDGGSSWSGDSGGSDGGSSSCD